MPESSIPLVSFVGTSKSGKTSFIEALIPLLKAQNLRIATIKHHHGDFEFDVPGKDTYRHKQAGASMVVLSSPHKMALLKDVERELSLREIVDRFVDGVDLVIVEGYKKEDIFKIEVFQYGEDDAPLSQRDRTIGAIVTDRPVATEIPLFAVKDVEGVARFIIEKVLNRQG